MNYKSTCLTTALLVALATLSAQAAEPRERSKFALGAEGGTTGFGPVLNYAPSPSFSLSVSYNFVAYDDDDIKGRDSRYDADIDLASTFIVASWHPFKNGFHVTGGAAFVDHEFDITARPRGGTVYEIGDNDYTNAQITSLRGQVENDQDVVPYVGAGWNWTFGQSGFSLTTHFGVLLADDYKVRLTATGPSASDPVLISDLRKEENEVSNDFSVYPVAKVGFLYRF